jgi:hypothetical protein
MNRRNPNIPAMKRFYLISFVTSMILGLWTLVAPSTFWGTIGISGSDPIVQAIYGAAICGEGIICGLGFLRPMRHATIFLYMVVYKSLVVLGLVPRLLLMENPPLAGWFIVAAWALAGIQAALVYPRGQTLAAEKE